MDSKRCSKQVVPAVKPRGDGCKNLNIPQYLEKGIVTERLTIAQKLLQKSLPVDFVAESTGLSLEDVQAIKQGLTH